MNYRDLFSLLIHDEDGTQLTLRAFVRALDDKIEGCRWQERP
jgi:hypothetical protein